MSLPWVRLETDIASHDKILRLLGQRGGKAAAAVYMFGLGWSGGQGTDGHILKVALPMIHGTTADAALLVRCGLWDLHPDGDGWLIRNYATRQELTLVSAVKRQAQSLAAARTNCIRWHGPECGCWQTGDEPPSIPDLSTKLGGPKLRKAE